MRSIDLNADLGEDAGDDAGLMALVTSANICCGAHAGGPGATAEALAMARQAGVRAGAHPGYADRANFGRTVVPMEVAGIERMVAGQITDFVRMADAAGVRLSYVKPHGALYNLAARDADVARAVARGVAAVAPGIGLLGLSGSALLPAAETAGLIPFAEAFADRAYAPDGSLVPRDRPGAVIHDAPVILARVLDMLATGQVTAADGTRLKLRVDSLCLHGDTPGALALAHHLRAGLQAAGHRLQPFLP